MRKLTALILSVVMLMSSVILIMAEETNEITVYVTISKHGEIVTDKNDNFIAMTPVSLSGKESYVLDDVFRNVHNEMCEAGESGYETSEGDFGLYISKFWEDTSGNFTYQVNFGDEFVGGPNHEIKNNDQIEFYINKSNYPDTEVYTRFDKTKIEVVATQSAELSLSQGEYTANGLEFSPCSDAVITINGAETDVVTDENGTAVICFDDFGEYVVSAKKTKTVNEETVTAIEAPFCVVTVTEYIQVPEDIPSDVPKEDIAVKLNAEEQMHRIVKKYFNNNIINDGNMYWFVADFADYLKIYPQSTYAFDSEQKQKIVDKAIDLADSSSSQSDLAKVIIVLRSLGYDAKNTYRKNGTFFDITEKLNSLITEETVSTPYYEYTLPYVMIALEQGENYVSSEKMELLLETAISNKASWQDTSWGIDGAAPMLRALAPYINTNEDLKAITDETAELIKNFQGNDGSMGNSASTGLAIAGLSAVGINSETVLKNENSLITGLMSLSNDTGDGFLPSDNSFGTEQGLRGLVSWKLCESNQMIYDFKNYPANTAKATPEVIHTPSYGGGGGGSSSKNKQPQKEAEVTKEPEIIEEKPMGLSGKNENVKILPVIFKNKTFEDIKNHQNQKAIEQLASRGIINGKTNESYSPDATMTRAEFATIAVNALGLTLKSDNRFKDINEKDWFNTYVSTAYSYGIVNGISDSEFNPYGKITREEAATMILRTAKLCGINTILDESGIRNSLAEFTDYKKISEWSVVAMAFCFNEEILDRSVIEIKPQEEITRAEVAQMLYNMLYKAKLL